MPILASQLVINEEKWATLSEDERVARIHEGRFSARIAEKEMYEGTEKVREALKTYNEKRQQEWRAREEAGRIAWVTLALEAIPNLNIGENADLNTVFNAVREARSKWRIDDTDISVVARLLRRELWRRKQTERPPLKQKRKKPETTALSRDGLIRAPADRFNKAAIESFMTGAMRKSTEMQTKLDALEARGLTESNQFWAAYPIETKANDLHGAIGFTKDPGEAIWNLLQKNGALAVKAQYALWARAYAETDAEPNQFIKMPITQFCDDLGFKKKGTVKKGQAHTSKNKQAAMNVLELLTSLELRAVYHPLNGTARRLRGPLWSRGIIAEEMDGYADLFGSNRVPGTKAMWEPVAFSYAPGPFFADEVWRTYNRNVALIGEGLLKLGSGYEDKYAVMVGGYLAILARMNGYRRTSVRVRLLLEKTGLWAVDAKTNPGRMREKLEAALDRIHEVGVVRGWTITTPPEGVNPDDFTSDETLTALAEPTRWTKEWLSQCVLIDWPTDMERRASELQAKRATAITRKRGRKSQSADKGEGN